MCMIIFSQRLSNDLNLMVVEEELHDQNMELLAQKSLTPKLMKPLTDKSFDRNQLLTQEHKLLKNDLEVVNMKCEMN